MNTTTVIGSIVLGDERAYLVHEYESGKIYEVRPDNFREIHAVDTYISPDEATGVLRSRFFGDSPAFKKFRFHWLDGKVEESEGYNVSDALSRLGYGGGAIRALDYWEEVREDKPCENY